jgi:nucleotide-binding universal stress UspA family protein
MFEQLLLAIDGSPASEVATSFAAAFAQHSSASVYVLCVNEYLVGGERGLTLHTHDDIAQLLTGAVLQLRESGVSASGSSCVATYRHVPKRIVQTAHEQGVDAIVLGSNRHRRFGRLFSARVRERTTRLASLPVLTAPAPLKVLSLNIDDIVGRQLNEQLFAPSWPNSGR